MHIANFDHLIVEASAPAGPDASVDDVERLVAALPGATLSSSGVVLIGMPNGKTLLRLFFSLLAAGYTPAMLSPTTPVVRIKQMAEDFGAIAIVKPRLGEELRAQLRIGKVEHRAGCEIGFFPQTRESVAGPGEVILTTSGTSSEFSSGCVHAFESLRENARRHAADIGLHAGDIVLVNLPLFYSFALVAQAIAGIECGAKLVISGPPFIAPRYFSELARHRISVSSVTPVLMRDILSHAADTLPSSLRALTIGGDFLPAALAAEFVARFPGNELYLTYGATEAGPRIATCRAHEVDERRLASVGKPMQGTEVRVLGDTPSSREGELLVRSSTLLKRKVGRNARDPLVELDGRVWLRTGDIFEIDDEGYLFFKHRKTDFVVLNDEKVNLAAIRQHCRSLPGVLTCKTRPLKRGDAVEGYQLEIVVDDRLVDQAGADDVKAQILKGLKHYERPAALTVTHVDRAVHEFYK
ncbi:class I adenylate-forming enzyme family protein [Burkholderia oklahomensis]|uniref:class I adenylate-forming enzyme family protein n=1 Tax=Burkholderia oklahomensis TaxID=342113 RepID=UPI00264AB8CF|nr:class I adenylate-forming enzyme family protein [Burkholderia oklahomensis]MDN7672258.1 class I adenylate-forming enzyme family protein [Burkholderia oklahomensis]